MSQKINFYSRLPGWRGEGAEPRDTAQPRVEPATCTEAEAFALRVLDDSMQPEFRQNCIIVIDPTGHARDGSYVLARSTELPDRSQADKKQAQADATDGFVFRQLRSAAGGNWTLEPLNRDYPSEATPSDLSRIIGVIVQRAGTRRSYHKHYD